MFKKKPTEQKFEFINQEIRFSEKPNSSVVCIVPIPKHLEFSGSEYGYANLTDPESFKSDTTNPLINLEIFYQKKCGSFSELENELEDYIHGLGEDPEDDSDDSDDEDDEDDDWWIDGDSIHIRYGTRTSCDRNEIISTKDLFLSSSHHDDLVSYYGPYDRSLDGCVDITFRSYTLIRENVFRFSLSISKEILLKKHLNLRRDSLTHEARTSQDWLHSYVLLFRQLNGSRRTTHRY